MKQVLFFANTPDDTNCVQASFRIMLKYFLPERDFSYKQLDQMSRKQPGKGTWWPPMLLALQKWASRLRISKRLTIEGAMRRAKPISKDISGQKQPNSI